MKTPTLITALAIVASVAACTTTEQMIEASRGECQAYGYRAGSEEYRACVMLSTQQKQVTEAENRQRASAALLAYSAATTPKTYTVNHTGNVWVH